MKKSRLLHALYASLFFLLSTTANAALVVPAGLNPGDAYHLMFVSSTTRFATSSDIKDYDDHVQSAADAAGIGSSIGVNWLAVGSTTSVSAYDHLSPLFSNMSELDTVPIYNQNGELVASSFNTLFTGPTTSLTNPIDYDENGNLLNALVYTGTFSTGVAYTNFTLGSANGMSQYGSSGAFGSTWVSNTSANASTNSLSIYGFSQQLAVAAVPLPAAVWLFGSGMLGLFGIARRKKS